MSTVERLPEAIIRALEEQELRLSMGANIRQRRMNLGLDIEAMARLVCCSVVQMRNVEEGVLYPRLPFHRMEALIILQRFEDRREGKRAFDYRIV